MPNKIPKRAVLLLTNGKSTVIAKIIVTSIKRLKGLSGCKTKAATVIIKSVAMNEPSKLYCPKPAEALVNPTGKENEEVGRRLAISGFSVAR